MNAEELAAAVEELDSRLERLRVLMEQYFQGIEKIPPFIVQKDVDRRIWVLRREKIRNTGTRFRFQQIIQRYNTFNSYWTRILREIENGTYKRDVIRAKRRFGDVKAPEKAPTPTSEPPPSVDLDMDMDMDLDDDLSDLGELGPLPVGPPPKPAAPPLNKPMAAPVVAKSPPQKPAALPVRPPPQKPPPSPSVPKILASKVESDDDLDDMLDAALGTGAPAKPAPAPARAPAPAPKPEPPKPLARPAPKPAAPKADEGYRKVYAQYVEARRANGESTAGLTYENLAKSLKDTTERLKTKSGGKAIDFEVATKDGKTILKPVVR